ncbi:MAG: N-acyl-D-amino-acid deacylase family protein [Candidatus Omnitrophota bacterium]
MKSIIFSLALIALFILSGCSTSSQKAGFDTLIMGGTIYDGTTRDPYVADIGIIADKIAAISDLSNATAKKVINAKEFIVTPGFIDVHNHTDLSILMALIISGKENDLSMITPAWKKNHNYLTQGVTTMVTGLCGGGFWDVNQWLGLIDSVKFSSNVYHMIPYGMLRYQLFGDNQPTILTADQLGTLKNMVEKEMKNGAIGISVGLEYAPDCFTTTGELVEIAKVVNKYGGIYNAHIRDNTGTIHSDGQPGVLLAIKETIEIGRRAQIPVHVSHIQLNLPWNNVEAKQMYGLIEQARAEGMDITADQHPYDGGYAILSYRLPAEFKTGLGVNEKYKTPEGKAQMKEAIKKVFTFLGPEKISLTSGPEKYHNKTIKEIAEIEGKDPAEVYVDLSCLEPAPFALFFEISDQVNRDNMPHDYIFTASDGFTVFKPEDSPHPRFFGCFPRKIKKYALEEKLLSLNDAIRSMTSLPAEKFKMKGRGKIIQENYADIVVIDLKNFTDRATYKDRSRYSEGVMYLLVNGVLSIENGKITGRRGGRALKRTN